MGIEKGYPFEKLGLQFLRISGLTIYSIISKIYSLIQHLPWRLAIRILMKWQIGSTLDLAVFGTYRKPFQ